MRVEINPFPGTKVAPDVKVKGIGSPFKRDGKVIGHIVGYRVLNENLILILEVDDDDGGGDLLLHGEEYSVPDDGPGELAGGRDDSPGDQREALPPSEGSAEPTG